MNHNDVRHRLSEYLDGSLTPEEQFSVEEHIKNCRECSGARQELQKTIEHLKTLEEVDPPPWMKQKIMARVRVDEEKKKGIFRRLFFPLHIKLPLEALGVLFLAVTTFLVYKDTNQVPNFSKGPLVQNFTKQEKIPAEPLIGKNKTENHGKTAIPSKKVPQEPGYKALDMKPAYEAPPPPVLEQRKETVPAPSDQAETEASRYKNFSDSPAIAPGPVHDQVPAAPGSTAHSKRESSESVAGQKRSMSTGELARKEYQDPEIIVSLEVKKIADSLKQVEDAVRQLEGKIIRKEVIDEGHRITTEIDSNKKDMLIERLKNSGNLKKVRESLHRGKDTIMEITILQSGAPQLP